MALCKRNNNKDQGANENAPVIKFRLFTLHKMELIQDNEEINTPENCHFPPSFKRNMEMQGHNYSTNNLENKTYNKEDK